VLREVYISLLVINFSAIIVYMFAVPGVNAFALIWSPHHAFAFLLLNSKVMLICRHFWRGLCTI